MKLREICRYLSLQVQASAHKLETDVTGSYISDLLSCMMARAQAGDLWITEQSQSDIVAVASLLNLAGIIITEGGTPDPDTLDKAEQEGIPIMTTPHTTQAVIGKLAELNRLTSPPVVC